MLRNLMARSPAASPSERDRAAADVINTCPRINPPGKRGSSSELSSASATSHVSAGEDAWASVLLWRADAEHVAQERSEAFTIDSIELTQ